MTIWVDDTHRIIQADDDDLEQPVAIDSCTALVLDADQTEAFRTAWTTPNGGVTFDGTTFDTLPVQQMEAATPPDPLKPYRDALSSAAASDPNLTSATKEALQSLLAAMAPQA